MQHLVYGDRLPGSLEVEHIAPRASRIETHTYVALNSHRDIARRALPHPLQGLPGWRWIGGFAFEVENGTLVEVERFSRDREDVDA